MKAPVYEIIFSSQISSEVKSEKYVKRKRKAHDGDYPGIYVICIN